MSDTFQRLWRASKLGLGAGALVAALVLVVGAVMFFRFECGPASAEPCVTEDCAPPAGSPQCEADTALAHDIARIESVAALGLGLLGLGTLLSLRTPKP